ncbi:MAG: hypothetical protein AW09_003748 [Candidatus Accumulibacter phosphatis]|uniref:Uncharacterized protein n=1 Tax=Candidatus Accumulibacter phosphatis TaxID=327160 RepID=A0A080M1V8_9PROT|nr:MAG: hypothetical protein AW09_003748 [Candidatus Accumulibacter phosphatis]
MLEKAAFITAGSFADRSQQFGEALRLALARLAVLIDAANLGGQPFETIAAVLGDVLFEFGLLCSLQVALRLGTLDLRILATPVFGEAGDALVEQPELEAGEVGFERFAAGTQILDLYAQRAMLLAVGDQRREQRHLSFGLEDGLMRAIQVVEMADQRRDPGLDIERFEHVAANEVGQITDRLHRHRLMKQIQRLFVVDAETTPEPGAVRRKTVEHLAARSPQPLAQRCDVRAKMGKVIGNRQIAFSGDEETRRLPLRVLDPEHLRQRHRLVVTGVVKDAEDHRVVVMVAQGYRPSRTADLVALGFVMAEHVGTQRALATVGAGSLVVGDALRRYQ